jgi:nitroreductase
MEFAALLAGRRSTRRFDTGRDVPDDVLDRILAAPLAMPHAGNTYDWRGVVLRRRDRDPQTWPAVFSALLEQSYVEEAAAVIVWAVQPGWWAERYRANVAELVGRGLIDPARQRRLLTVVERGLGDPGGPAGDGRGSGEGLTTLLIGEAMMGVAAAMLAALDAGLGATVTACRPADLAGALGLPDGAVLCPAGVLAVGWAAPEPAQVAPAGGAPKPPLAEQYFSGRWGRR